MIHRVRPASDRLGLPLCVRGYVFISQLRPHLLGADHVVIPVRRDLPDDAAWANQFIAAGKLGVGSLTEGFRTALFAAHKVIRMGIGGGDRPHYRAVGGPSLQPVTLFSLLFSFTKRFSSLALCGFRWFYLDRTRTWTCTYRMRHDASGVDNRQRVDPGPPTALTPGKNNTKISNGMKELHRARR